MVVLLRLLSDLCELNWKCKESAPVMYQKRPLSSDIQTPNEGIGSSSQRLNYYTTKPDPIPAELAKRSLATIAKLKSSRDTMVRLLEIRGKSSREPKEHYHALFENIDANCITIFRYLSASNPAETLDFIQSKLTALYGHTNDDSDYVQYQDFLAHIYMTGSFLTKFQEVILASVDKIRKPIHLQLVLSFSSQSIRFWLTSSPKNFLDSIKTDNSIPIFACALFDSLSIRLPDFLTNGYTAKFACLLMILSPTTFEEYMKHLNPVPGKMKHSVSLTRQLNFLKSIVKQVTTKGPLISEYTDCMVTIMLLAGSFKRYDPNSDVFRFSLLYADDVFETLAISNPTKYCVGSDFEVIDELRVEFIMVSTTLMDAKYTATYKLMLKDPNANLATLRLLTAGLYALSTNPDSRSIFVAIVEDCAACLKDILLKSCEILKLEDLDQLSYPSTPLIDKPKDDSLNLTLSESKSSSYSDTSIKSPLTPSHHGSQASRQSSKKETTSSFKINRHKLDMKKHMSFKNNSSSPTSGSSTLDASSASLALNVNANSKQTHYRTIDIAELLPEYYRDVVKNCFGIFKSRPLAYLIPNSLSLKDLPQYFNDKERFSNFFRSLDASLSPLVHLFGDDDFEVVESLLQFILGIVDKFSKATTADVASLYNFATIVLLKSISSLVAEYIRQPEKTNKLFSTFVTLMETRHDAFEKLKANGVQLFDTVHEPKLCRVGFMEIEKAFITGFLVSDLETYRLVKRGLQFLLLEASKRHLDECFNDMNLDFYKAIADDNSTITSFTAVLKKTRKYFVDKVFATTGLTKIWFVLYQKWFEERDTVTTVHLGYIVAIAGVFLKPEFKNEEIRESVIEKLHYIIDTEMDALTADEFKIREGAKEILSTEMNPQCYGFVVDHIKDRTAKIAEKKVPSEKDLLMIDQFSLIARAIFQADTQFVYLLMTEILEAIQSWAKIIDLAEDDVMGFKLKLRHAKLGQALDPDIERFSNSGLLKMRNIFARIYLEWIESALFKNLEQDNKYQKVITLGSDRGKTLRQVDAKVAKELSLLALDVGLECSSSLAKLLAKLPLETPQASHERELKRSRKMIFGNYFSVLYKILDKFNSTGAPNDLSLSSRHKVSSLVENAITGLTNLLDANVDVGFEFALPLNFHKDRKIKLSFLKVFANIVDKLDINDDGLDQRRAALSKTIATVMEVPQMTLAVASVCSYADVDSLALTFLNGSEDQSKVLNVLATLIRQEITNSKTSSEILRSNSVATRMLALYCKREGSDYLVKVLKPTLSRIASLSDNFEVEKLSLDDPHAEDNVDKFMFYLNEIIKQLFDSVKYIPNEFKYLCSVIYDATGKAFPDAKIYAVGAFIFLRLIAPAIVNPDANEIISVEVDRPLKRSFIQLAKVLQLMANSSITSIRWPLLLSKMNELTIMNVQVTRFLQTVSKFNPKRDQIKSESNCTLTDGNFIHHMIYDNLRRIRESFTADKTLPLADIIRIYSSFDKSICEAGQPFSSFGYTISNFVKDKDDQENSLYEFMIKTSMKDISSNIRENISHETISADGTPTVVMNYNCLEHTSVEDAELLMFRFYQVASKIWDNPFYSVVDCSGFSRPSDFMNTLCRIFKAYTPQSVAQNMTRIYFYNVSQKFFADVVSCAKFMQSNGYAGEIHFNSSFDSGNFGFGLSRYTTSMNEDARVTFHDVSLYEPSQNRFVPVTVKIGDEFLQVGFKQPTRFKLSGQMKSVILTDVYPIIDLSDAKASSITGVPDEISIHNTSDDSTLILSSPKKIEIMRTLYFAKSRYDATLQRLKEGSEDEGRKLDVWLGELINIDFVGLLSKDEEVRKASYILLCSLGHSFKLELGAYFDSSTQVSFPQNNVSFIISNARLLSENYKEYTYEIVNGFFNAYKHCEEYQRISAVMYISPFIKYLFAAIDSELESKREEKTSSLIKKFIEVSTMYEGTLVAFHAHIWSQLTLQDKVAETLIVEAVAASIDREAEGRPWDDIISLVTLTPTLKICSSVIKRLRELSFISRLTSEDSIAAHTNWIEITVLVKVCVALFFDSILFTEMFMPDILYITTMFMDIGPFELRTSLYKLLLNVFHSALLKEDLDPERRLRAITIVNKFHDLRFTMLLGLNREDTRSVSPENDAEISNRITSLEMLCDSLFEFVHLAGDEELSNVWRSRWHSLAVSAAFREDSMLQDRAFLILGFLSKHGVTDMIIDKILTTMIGFGEGLVDRRTFSRALSSIYALSRAIQGISPTSAYSEMFYWLAINLNYNSNILFAHAAVQLLGNALVAIDNRGKFINGEVIQGILNTRSVFAQTIEKYEELYRIKVNLDNIDLVIVSIFIRDLQAAFTKNVAVDALRNAFTVRVNNALLRERITGVPSDKHCIIYAVVLYIICRSDAEFYEMVSDSDLDVTDLIEVYEDVKVPTRLVEFLISTSDQAILTMMKCAGYIRYESSDEKTQIRFLALYQYVAQRSEKIKWMIYPEIRPALRTLAVGTVSPTLSKLIFDIAKDAVINPEYENFDKYAKEMDELVAKYNLVGLRNVEFSNIHPFQSTEGNIIPTDIKADGTKLITEMIRKIVAAVMPDD